MDIQRIVAELRGEMERIGHAIGLLEGNTTAKARVGRPPDSPGRSPVRRRGGITPAGRRRLAEAMRQRWAQRRGAPSASKASVKATSVNKPQKRGGITPAGRKRLAEAMRKRWAEKKRMAKS